MNQTTSSRAVPWTVAVAVLVASLSCSEAPVAVEYLDAGPSCASGDGRCSPGCGPLEDSDCTGCGDGTVATTEACDTSISSGPGACPSSCPSSLDACAPSVLRAAGTCEAACVSTPVTSCVGGDGCCPAECTSTNDADCAGCGDGTVATGEACDTGISSGPGACPSSCSSSVDACAPRVLRNPGTCAAACVPTPITTCIGGDGCCPVGCSLSGGDSDCATDLIDTSGTWATKISTPGRIKTVSTLGITLVDAAVTITAWIRDSVSPDGTIVHRICKMTTEGPTMRNTYSQAFFDTLVETTKRGDIRVPIGASVTIPEHIIYSGRDSTSPKPNAIDDPPVGDGDGKAGVTVRSWTQTFDTTLDAYVGLVLLSSTSGVTLTDANTLTGFTSFSSKGYVFNSSKSLLVGPASTIDQTTDAAQIPFTLVKLDADGSHDCAYVTSHF